MPVGFKSRVKSDAVRITLREAKVEEKELLLAVLAKVCVCSVVCVCVCMHVCVCVCVCVCECAQV